MGVVLICQQHQIILMCRILAQPLPWALRCTLPARRSCFHTNHSLFSPHFTKTHFAVCFGSPHQLFHHTPHFNLLSALHRNIHDTAHHTATNSPHFLSTIPHTTRYNRHITFATIPPHLHHHTSVHQGHCSTLSSALHFAHHCTLHNTPHFTARTFLPHAMPRNSYVTTAR